jgi:hypothetical protein
MKKNVLALSITAALVGLTGGAHAMTGALGGADATVQEFNGQGVGHSLIIPYFTTQDKNNTLINIVNTDLHNGKAVKVRFRGASNSDDIFDFQVFLSPGDVWAANIAQGADGKSRLVTNDVSCTKPDRSVLNGASFLTARLDQTLTPAQLANGTREGYVEIFNMGDIPRASIALAAVDAAKDVAAGVSKTAVNPLYTAIKHVSNVAPCSSATAPGTAESAGAWSALDTVNLQYGGPAATTPVTAGLLPPTTGLFANWTIINVVGAAAWSGEAVAVEARVAPGVVATAPTATPQTAADRVNMGNVVYWPQTTDLVDAAGFSTQVELYSADALFRTANVYTASGSSGAVATMAAATTAALPASFYDLPDMSTPYLTIGAGVTRPLTQAATLTASLATRSVRNEFFTDTGVSATTDWLFSMPTRRYSVGFDYSITAATTTATNDGRRFTNITADGPPLAVSTIAYFNPQNTSVNTTSNGNGRQVCVAPATTVGFVLSQYNREETRPTGAAPGVVISPSPIVNPNKLAFCGEASVLSINNGGILAGGTGSLKASVAVQDADVTYRDGWMTVLTPPAVGALIGLPVLGSSFSRALGNAGGQTFGISSNHRFQR